MSFAIPEGITSWSEKLAYCVAAQEKLRLDHNSHGAEFLSQAITEADWESYKSQVFEPLSVEIGLILNSLEHPEEYPTVDLAWFTEDGLELPVSDWPEQYGLCVALLKQELTEEQAVLVREKMAIPQDALDAITLFTQSLSNVQSFLILKDGSKHPITMEVDSIQYSDGRVDKILRVPTINTGVATN
jgi:hypothetical protein